jgi:hypothetical protein
MTDAGAEPLAGADAERVASLLREAFTAAELEWDEPRPGHLTVVLPGEHKQRTACAFVVGQHALSVNAFVARRPDENHEALYRWLLERNVRMYGVAFALDAVGDVFLVGRISLALVDAAEIDRLLGSVLEYADSSFDVILATGFPSAIRREYSWRVKQGEPTDSLAAFDHLTRDL